MINVRQSLFAMGALFLLVGCGQGSAGEISNPQAASLDFVESEDLIFVATGEGLVQIRVNGEDRELVHSDEYSRLDVAANHSVWALESHGGYGGNLYLRYEESRELIRIPELDERIFAAAVNADGSRVAASRWADPRLEPEERVYDDNIYLIDTETHQVEILAAESDRLITYLRWNRDGTTLYAGLTGKYVQIDTETGERVEIDAHPGDEEIYSLRFERKKCEESGDELVHQQGGEGIDVLRADGERERLLEIPRRQGGSPSVSLVNDYFFTESCQEVVFDFGGKVWVIDVESKVTAPLLDGSNPRVIARYEL